MADQKPDGLSRLAAAGIRQTSLAQVAGVSLDALYTLADRFGRRASIWQIVNACQHGPAEQCGACPFFEGGNTAMAAKRCLPGGGMDVWDAVIDHRRDPRCPLVGPEEASA